MPAKKSPKKNVKTIEVFSCLMNEKLFYKLNRNNEALTGLIISDAHISGLAKKTAKTQCFTLEQVGEHQDMITFFQNMFTDLLIPSSTRKYLRKHKKSKTRKKETERWYNKIVTGMIPFFYNLRKDWYDENRVKIVPRYLKLTPKTLAFWYMGDGSSSPNSVKKKNLIVVDLATENFLLDDVEFLRKKIKKLGLNFRVQVRNKKYFALKLYRIDEVNKFMKMVEPYMLPSYRYKIKYAGKKILSKKEINEIGKKRWVTRKKNGTDKATPKTKLKLKKSQKKAWAVRKKNGTDKHRSETIQKIKETNKQTWAKKYEDGYSISQEARSNIGKASKNAWAERRKNGTDKESPEIIEKKSKRMKKYYAEREKNGLDKQSPETRSKRSKTMTEVWAERRKEYKI